MFFSNPRNFDVGDEVEFETSLKGSNLPRWDVNIDTGGSGIWAKGKIVKIDEYEIEVEYEIDGYWGKGICHFLNYNNPAYVPYQWQRDGFLRKKYGGIWPKCECGSEKTYGKKTNLHTRWCPLYNRS